MEIQSASFYRGAYSSADFPRDQRPQFAIVGRSNVGKSSLINAILGRKTVARVSQTPGKTQAVHFYLINERFYIVDLPGYGYAKASKTAIAGWSRLVHSYIEKSASLQMIFLLLDSRRAPSIEDLTMVNWMNETATPWRAILTKSDKLSNNQLARAAQQVGGAIGQEKEQLIFFSKLTKRGVDAVWRDVDSELAALGTRLTGSPALGGQN